MATFHFELLDLPSEAGALRTEVREFLRETVGAQAPHQRARSWGGFDREFSKKVAARGWVGMTWPKQYGGHERSALERYVVLEEMLAAGAPVSAHWVADRQSGPLLLRFGTEAQRERFLPRIARGELAFAIGMSEPDSGSDLASIRTRAEKVSGGYRVNGTKVWTSNAHISDYMIALFRTRVVPDKKHEGLSQFLVDTKTPGINIRPIIDLAGGHHFNEVIFQDAFVPEDMRVGRTARVEAGHHRAGLRAERPSGT
jgi:acyl-CoA dehydrogenase